MDRPQHTSSNGRGDQLVTRPDQHARVARLGLYALENPTLQDLMDEAVRSVGESLDLRFCNVYLLEPGGDTFLVRAGTGWNAGVVGKARVSARPDTQAGFTLATSEAIVVSDAEGEERFALSDMLKDHGIRSGISVSIAGAEQPYGVLGAFCNEARTYADEDVHFMQAVANVLAGAIERRRFEDALRESEARARRIEHDGRRYRHDRRIRHHRVLQPGRRADFRL